MRIESFSFGSISIDGEHYRKDVLLLPPRVVSPWWREAGHMVAVSDLHEVLEYSPIVLVVGTGASSMMKVPETVVRELESAGMRVELFTTENACDRFNRLLENRERVAGAFHLTC